MQRLEVSCAVRRLCMSLGAEGFKPLHEVLVRPHSLCLDTWEEINLLLHPVIEPRFLRLILIPTELFHLTFKLKVAPKRL